MCRDGPDNPVITEADLIAGCAMQMRGTLQVDHNLRNLH